ncbi:MAG: lysylphosphatidylglycerol synthase transmembrane domain-containing protein [Syntrophomonadaceae bacterium]|nr:lysylphosphatidylglycerol synthase transmembrane domain-containing protein [Syntrophomonadaceae bacterium]
MKKLEPAGNWKVAIKAAVSILLLLWLGLSIDWRKTADILLHTQPVWIFIAILWIIFSMVVSVSKWKLLLNVQTIYLRWTELWRVYWAGIFFNNFLPSSIGGDAFRIFRVAKSGQDNAGAVASVVVERILATTAIAIVGITGGFWAGRLNGQALTLLLGLVIITLLLLGIIFRGKLPASLSSKNGRIIDFLQGMSLHGSRMQANPGAILTVLLLSVVFQLAVVGVNYSIFRALGITSLGWGEILFVVPITSVAAMLPVGINGYGVREGAYVGLLASFSVPRETAFTSSILFAVLVSFCSLYGGWTFWSYRKEESNL